MLDDLMKKRDMFCRRAVVADAGAIAQVQVDSWRAAYKELLPADFLANLSVSQWSRMWEHLFVAESGRSATFVAGYEDAIQGFASVGPARAVDLELNWGELFAIYVDQAVWGGGIGYQLLQTSCTFLEQAEYEQGVLWVLDGNDRAMRFYERYGFVKDRSPNGIKLDQLADIPVRELRYQLSFA